MQWSSIPNVPCSITASPVTSACWARSKWRRRVQATDEGNSAMCEMKEVNIPLWGSNSKTPDATFPLGHRQFNLTFRPRVHRLDTWECPRAWRMLRQWPWLRRRRRWIWPRLRQRRLGAWDRFRIRHKSNRRDIKLVHRKLLVHFRFKSQN